MNSFCSTTFPNKTIKFEAGEPREEKVNREINFKDCFVEVSESIQGAKTKKVTSFMWGNPEIKVKVQENKGQIQVFYEGKKLPGCYCKVYQMKGEGKFYRDGYSDITGTFKYALADLDGISKFAILVMTDNGGVVQIAKPPSQQGFLG